MHNLCNYLTYNITLNTVNYKSEMYFVTKISLRSGYTGRGNFYGTEWYV